MNAAEFYTAAGFRLINAGGNCMVYQRRNDRDGTYILVTAQGDNYAPDTAAEAVDVGLYATGADHSECIAQLAAETGDEALRLIAAGKWEKSR